MTATAALVHHASAPTPDGCRWCGDPHATHGYTFSLAVGGHLWESPTSAQRLARMRARRRATARV